MKLKRIVFIICFMVFCHVAGQTSPDTTRNPCLSCEELANVKLPDVRIHSTEQITEGTVHCKLLGTIGAEINFELLLPEDWNIRFVMGGGGGFVGTIVNQASWNLNKGYATAGTDTGHKGHVIKAEWALNNMERQVNFGHLAIHRTTEVSKAIISEYYCQYPEYSYFFGCSRGGGQALIEAQRYPEDFNGIVAAAPILDWPATGAEFIQNSKVLYPNPRQLSHPLISESHLRILQKAVLDQCDNLDGLEDNILNDPRDCIFDFSSLPLCPPGKENIDCFRPDQVEAVKLIYSGAANQQHKLYPGFPFGCESEPDAWNTWIVGPNPGTMPLNFPSLHYGFGTELFKYLIYNDPEWDYSTYDFSNFESDTKLAASNLNATHTDYSDFKSRGGKLLIWHGWNDPALSAFTAIDHYEAVKQNDQDIDEYIRLFLLSGVLHCYGGPGPSEADWIEIVRDWVENGKKPDRIVVTKSREGKVIMSRPVFPYPYKAIYNGSGDPNLASSFSRND